VEVEPPPPEAQTVSKIVDLPAEVVELPTPTPTPTTTPEPEEPPAAGPTATVTASDTPSPTHSDLVGIEVNSDGNEACVDSELIGLELAICLTR
jgi:hypothetical protein